MSPWFSKIKMTRNLEFCKLTYIHYLQNKRQKMIISNKIHDRTIYQVNKTIKINNYPNLKDLFTTNKQRGI